MYTSVNHNLITANTARNLNQHYAALANSTQRLSSGLRINSAADDATGLAIRELQRAEIATFHQGARNANDAISMIQVADGAWGIIDEKLIRMKELAEQAATGTYDSTQRLIIESEYQAMASEITRIANATDFNGIKLLNGSLKGAHNGSGMQSTGAMKIHFGTGNDSAEDYYYVEIGNCTAGALGVGNSAYISGDKITYVKKDIFEEVHKTFEANNSYIEYVDPETGNKYYTDGNFYFTDINDPAGSSIDNIQDGEIIKRLETVPESTRQYGYYYARVDPATNIEYYLYKGQYTINPLVPDSPKLDPANSGDKQIIDRLQYSSKTIRVGDEWKIYMDPYGAKFYTYDNGLSFIPDPTYPNENILDSNNPVHNEQIKTFVPSLITATSKMPVTDTTYLVYIDSTDSLNEYYSSDGGKTFVKDGARTETSQLDPVNDKKLIDRLVPDIDAFFTRTYYEIYYDPDDNNKRYYTFDEGLTFTDDYKHPENIILDSNNPNDLAHISRLLPEKSHGYAYVDCEVYEDSTDVTKKYYSRDGGQTFFVDVNDPFSIVLDASNPNHEAEINKLIPVDSDMEITIPFVHYRDPVSGDSYYSRNNGLTFINDLNNPDQIVLDSNIAADKTFIDTLQLVPFKTYDPTWYDIYINPDDSSIYYTEHYGNKDVFYSQNNFPNDIFTLPQDATLIDKLEPVQKTKTFGVIREEPIYTEIYKDPDTGQNYYSPDGGKTFTTNPYDPDDAGSYLDPNDPDDQKVLDKLQPVMAAQKTGEIIEEAITPGEGVPAEAFTVSTQEAAQRAIVGINNAIISKDKIRAHLGALQNRLENTVSNLNIQAESLQAAESRISDVDVAAEMTEFVRNQVLTQSVVAMLSQANSMPQMIMSIIQG